MIIAASARVALAQPGAVPAATPAPDPAADPTAAPTADPAPDPAAAPTAAPAPAPADPAAAPAAAPGAVPPAAPGASAASAAVPGGSAGADDPTTHSDFVVIDQLDGSSAAGLQISYFTLPSEVRDAPTLLRIAAHARYVDPGTGLGAYVRVPFAYASSTGDTDSITDVGDIELGGMFASRQNAGGLGVLLRAGVTLPTGESQPAATVGTLGNFLAMPDLYNSLPGGTTLKLGVSPVVRSGPVFARIDLGLDWNLDAKDATIGKALHWNFGLGIDLGGGSVMLESENTTLFSDRDMVDAASVDAFAISARFHGRSASPYFALVLPLDDDLKDVVGLMITAGVEFRM